MKKVLLGVFVFVSLTAETLMWDAPTKHEDGTDISPGELKEYRIYDQRKLVKIVPVPTTSTSISPGTSAHVWEATVKTFSGSESKYSNAVQWYPTPLPTIQWPPAGPANLQVK